MAFANSVYDLALFFAELSHITSPNWKKHLNVPSSYAHKVKLVNCPTWIREAVYLLTTVIFILITGKCTKKPKPNAGVALFFLIPWVSEPTAIPSPWNRPPPGSCDTHCPYFPFLRPWRAPPPLPSHTCSGLGILFSFKPFTLSNPINPFNFILYKSWWFSNILQLYVDEYSSIDNHNF